MKRPLSDDEKRITENSLKRIKEEIADLTNVHLPDAELTYNYKLDYSYRKQKKEYLDVINQIKTEITGKQKLIETLTDQLNNGVEIKEVSQLDYPMD